LVTTGAAGGGGECHGDGQAGNGFGFHERSKMPRLGANRDDDHWEIRIKSKIKSRNAPSAISDLLSANHRLMESGARILSD
jgi:hypothetical protein